ncbi:TPA: hypothetical protein N0F65_008387 [Lagenidium giganteum]|uniref:PNPLA domain-containing protein n=1 Tax=Lagenidium giganteum TaxID=4803 RepID=A0AAV2YVJ0_9STRA|nr:TPA: hypothetical protein N0F65_008387 [Lagenidium giganteum]
MYMFGVAKALRQHGLDQNARFIGTSGGALVSIALTMGSDFDAIRDTIIARYLPQAHAGFLGLFKMRDYLSDCLDRHAKLHQYQQLNENEGKFTAVYSSISAWRPRRVTRFQSADHLKSTLIASCCATPFPLFDDTEDTITISPNVHSCADIRPSRHVPVWWSMLPPSKNDMEWLYQLGYEDGLNWIARNGLGQSLSDAEIPTAATASDRKWETKIGECLGYRTVDKWWLRLRRWIPRAAVVFLLCIMMHYRVMKNGRRHLADKAMLMLYAHWRLFAWTKTKGWLPSMTKSKAFVSA